MFILSFFRIRLQVRFFDTDLGRCSLIFYFISNKEFCKSQQDFLFKSVNYSMKDAHILIEFKICGNQRVSASPKDTFLSELIIL